MMTNFRPTRAEASDVANAVYEGADALMLSGETSVGNYPVEVIRSMQQVINATEGNEFSLVHEHTSTAGETSYLSDVVCYNACKMADLTLAKGIVIFTFSGKTVYKIAGYRPKCSIYAFTPQAWVKSQLSLVWGAQCFDLEGDVMINDAIAQATATLKAKALIKSGDVIVFVGGIPMKTKAPINMMKIAQIE
jgi:pyruvate kinase